MRVGDLEKLRHLLVLVGEGIDLFLGLACLNVVLAVTVRVLRFGHLEVAGTFKH